jgi:hypothetical protein
MKHWCRAHREGPKRPLIVALVVFVPAPLMAHHSGGVGARRFGADLPIITALLLQPAVRVVGIIGGTDNGPPVRPAFRRFGVGLTGRVRR